MTLLVALSVAWLYGATLQGLLLEWFSSADSSYGIVLAAVALAVMWRRREAFARATDPRSNAVTGTTALLLALGLYMVGQLAADVFLTRISFVAVLAGAVWLLAGGRAVRTIAAPLLFLLMAIPLPALVVNAVTLPLQLVASRIGETTLTAAGVSVFRDGNLLELPSTTLEVADACSGLRSIVSLAAIGGLLAWTEPSWPRRLVLLTAGLPIAIVMNGLRIAATGFACEHWSARVAAEPWHTFAGWLTFVVSVFALVRLQRALSTTAHRAEWDLNPVQA
ncbi:MAG: exosortase/archaeosortase family protein [Vicinamibacterales bacterium]